jgi:UDP-N-acetylglucosamine 2-epimerase
LILSVVGARPQFIKAAVVSRGFAAAGIEERIVHTGQHYDDAMSGRFLRELGIDNVIANLGCGSGSHANQTARMMTALEEIMLEHARRVRAVLVYGDTNSSIAAALVATKLVFPVVHVEAGLRSFNRSMPEEVNRVVVDHLSDLLFCSSKRGVAQLAREGIEKPVIDVGDVMLDAFQTFTPEARRTARRDFLRGPPFAIVTIHRQSNADDQERLARIVEALGGLRLACVWPVHPRLGEQMKQRDLPINVHCVAPLSYFEMLVALETCRFVITDSGGLQKETYWARKPCITVRSETEWVETLDGGWNQLWDPVRDSLQPALDRCPTTAWRPLYGDGKASERIAEGVGKHLL